MFVEPVKGGILSGLGAGAPEVTCDLSSCAAPLWQRVDATELMCARNRIWTSSDAIPLLPLNIPRGRE